MIEKSQTRLERKTQFYSTASRVLGRLGIACLVAGVLSSSHSSLGGEISSALPLVTSASSGNREAIIEETDEGVTTAAPSVLKEEQKCQEGIPVTFDWEAMGMMDVSVEGIGLLPNKALDTPGKFNVGWYEYGPKPGSERGRVPFVFHMYPDGSGLAGLEFEQNIALQGIGSIIKLTMDNGSNCLYEVDFQKTVDKFDKETGFPAVGREMNLFSNTDKSQLVMITCAGPDWNFQEGTSQGATIATAFPIN